MKYIIRSTSCSYNLGNVVSSLTHSANTNACCADACISSYKLHYNVKRKGILNMRSRILFSKKHRAFVVPVVNVDYGSIADGKRCCAKFIPILKMN